MSCQCGNPSKIQIQGLLSRTFQTQSQDYNGVWTLKCFLLIVWKRKKRNQEKVKGLRLELTVLSCMLFSSFPDCFLRLKICLPNHGTAVLGGDWWGKGCGAPLAPGDTSILEKQLFPLVRKVSWELCHQRNDDSKFSYRIPLSLFFFLLDLILCINPVNHQAQVNENSIIVHSNEAYKNSK